MAKCIKINYWSDFIGNREETGYFYGGTAIMPRRCEDRKCSG
jgi:hypothetical protein